MNSAGPDPWGLLDELRATRAEVAELRAALIHPPKDPGELLTVKQGAGELGITEQALYKRIKAGHIKVVRSGRAVRIARRELAGTQ